MVVRRLDASRENTADADTVAVVVGPRDRAPRWPSDPSTRGGTNQLQIVLLAERCAKILRLQKRSRLNQEPRTAHHWGPVRQIWRPSAPSGLSAVPTPSRSCAAAER